MNTEPNCMDADGNGTAVRDQAIVSAVQYRKPHRYVGIGFLDKATTVVMECRDCHEQKRVPWSAYERGEYDNHDDGRNCAGQSR